MPPSKKKTPVKSKKSAAKPKSFIVKTKIPKDPKAPKGALTAFMIYSSEMRPKLSPDISFGESGKQLGEQWRSLKPAQKAKFEKKAQADKERYQSEMAKYKPSAKMAKEIADAKAKAPKLKADPNAPKRGRSSYIVFSDLHRPAIAKKNPNMKMTELSVKLGALWKKVTPTEKKKCEAIAEKEKAAYEKALAKYTPSAEYQAAIDHLAKAKAKLSGGDKKAKTHSEKKKATALKAKTKKLKEDAKKKAAAVKKAEAQLKKMAAAEEKLAVMKAKALAASKALNAHEKEAGGAKKSGKKSTKKAPPKIAEAVAVDGPKKSIKKSPAAKKASKKK